MGLNYDLTKVKDFESLAPDMTQTMVFTTMGVGMGDLTEKNAHEFYARSRINSLLWGLKDDPVTPEVVQAYIGMKTNVSYETPSKWASRTVKYNMENQERQYRAEIKAREETQNDG